ncbi:hypothetical protein [Lentzea sp. NEAU-D7]|uniref:hypothetical protein n=1 Tax=Lentzea sp. NEAU-D7 TaxID=2994667 RepID=UPI00224AFAF9|nr:hypothetical protein [Lentzea sp. NEAU-D7]MCX2950851.1 hypothetical protein [Lentzea sp. NEAU-D7]
MTAPKTEVDTRFYTAQQRIVRTAANEAQTAWRRLDSPAADSAAATALRLQVVATIEEAQAEAAALAPLYIAATLAALGAVSNPVGALVSAMFAGLATNGMPLSALVDFALRRYRLALLAGVPPSEAHALGLAKLLTYVTTEAADAGRLARHTAAILEPELAGYERVVTLPACGRCILLAGRLYSFSTGFERHPTCDCDMKPVTHDQWHNDRPSNTPRGLFESMTPAQQNKAFGPGDAEAIRAGADISRTVNARRKNAVYVAGGHEYTLDATTVRGHGRQLGELGKQGGRYSRSRVPRPTAAQLVNTARDRDELIRQLGRFGYVR